MSEPLSPSVLAEGRRLRDDAVAHGRWPVILHADHPWAVWLNDHGDALLAAVEELEKLKNRPENREPPSKRVVCASCGKGPATDAEVAIYRVNIKGIPGVFLCQWCRPEARADPASSQEDVTAALRSRLGEVVRALARLTKRVTQEAIGSPAHWKSWGCLKCVPRIHRGAEEGPCARHDAIALLASPDMAALKGDAP